MKKLLNTLYVVQENAYLSRESDNIVIKVEGKTIARYPYRIIESIICFSYVGISPSLMSLCVTHSINLSIHNPRGQFLCRIIGKTNGNVLLRREQYRLADSDQTLEYAKRFIISKISNSRKYVLRFKRDHKTQVNVNLFEAVNNDLLLSLENIKIAKTKDELRGFEGAAASSYFCLVNDIVLKNKNVFHFNGRSKRPPMDCVNALLSFGYSLLTTDCQSAIEAVGLDSYVGFFHTDRPGRAGLALDLVEEFRNYIVDRLVFSMINNEQLNSKHFEIKENGSVLLNDIGRKIFLEEWQRKKHIVVEHPFTGEKVKMMLLPYVQAQLLAKAIRGELPSYPPFMI